MTGLGAQLGDFHHGIGTKHPFRFLTFKNKSAEELKSALDQLNLAGLSYKILTLMNAEGKPITGVYVVITDWSSWGPTDLAFAMMSLSAKWQNPSPFLGVKTSEANLFNKHVGSTAWWNYIQKAKQNIDPRKFERKWKNEVSQFKSSIKPFLLYP